MYCIIYVYIYQVLNFKQYTTSKRNSLQVQKIRGNTFER